MSINLIVEKAQGWRRERVFADCAGRSWKEEALQQVSGPGLELLRSDTLPHNLDPQAEITGRHRSTTDEEVSNRSARCGNGLLRE
jgi:hypothetical protein